MFEPYFGSFTKMTTLFRRILTIGSMMAAFGFAQEAANPDAQWDDATASVDPAPATDSVQTAAAASNDTTSSTVADSTVTPAADTVSNAATDTAKVAAVDSTAAVDTLKADTAQAEPAQVKPRNKITYAEYQAKVNANAKKRSRTLHHGLSTLAANYHDKRYGNMDIDADWGSGIGLYYFYRRYFGHYLGFQGRLGALYRYSSFKNYDQVASGKLDDGKKYNLVYNIDRKYHNFAADLPLTGKLGYHVKGTTAFIFLSGTLDITKPIFEMVDTENYLFLESSSKTLNDDMRVLTNEGKNPFPLYESHQTNDFYHMDDWETSGWLGLGVESRLVSFEFQVYTIGGATKDNSHRYYPLGHDSNFSWRFFLDFSIR